MTRDEWYDAMWADIHEQMELHNVGHSNRRDIQKMIDTVVNASYDRPTGEIAELLLWLHHRAADLRHGPAK